MILPADDPFVIGYDVCFFCKQYLSYLCIIIFFVFISEAVTYEEARLRNDLLSKYQYGRPVVNPMDAVNVNVTFNLLQVKQLVLLSLHNCFADVSIPWY